MVYIPEYKEILLSKGDYLKIDTQYYKYYGNVKTVKEVPASNCLYTIDSLLYIRRVDMTRLNRAKVIKQEVKKTDDSGELDLEIKPGDDSTLIIVKELLKGFTKNSLRGLFDNDSDFNNMRRAIEKSPNGQLSLNRFKIILDKLGLDYRIIVFSDSMSSKKTNFDDKLELINSDDFGKNVEEPK